MDSTSAPSSGRGPTSAGGDKSTAEADTIMEPLGRVLDSMMNSLLKPKRTQVSKDCENIRSISSVGAAKNGSSLNELKIPIFALQPRPNETAVSRSCVPRNDKETFISSDAETLLLKTIVSQQMTPGTIGRQVQLLANYYKITTADVVVVHYDVEITKAESDQFAKKAPAGPSKNETETAVVETKKTKNKAFVRFFSGYSDDIIKALITANQAIFKDLLYVWDGQRNLFTTRLLNLSGGGEQVFNNLKVEIPGGRPSFFKLKVKLVSRVDLSEMTSFYDMKTGEINNRVLSIFEIVFRFMCTGPFESHRQKFFDINTRRPLGFKASLADFVNGFISSLRITEFGLALNGHLKAAGLITKSFTTLPLMVASLAGVRDLDRPDQLELVPEWKWQEINKVLRRLKIFTSHTKRRMFYTVDRLMPGDTPQRMTLQLPDEQEMTIAAYFQTIYGINLQKLPLVQISGRKRRCYLPMELCYLVDKQFLSHYSMADNETAQSYELPGRVLPPAQMSGQRGYFYQAGTVPTRWGVLVLDRSVPTNEVSFFVESILLKAGELGLQFASQPSPIMQMEVRTKEGVRNIFAHLQQKTNTELVFMGIPKENDGVSPQVIYNLIKHYCDQKYGIISCCFMTKYITEVNSGARRSYLENFLLKVNRKLSGLNMVIDPWETQNQLPFSMARTMVMGVVVNRLDPKKEALFLVSAAVGSYDNALTQYTASIRAQKKEKSDATVKQLDLMTSELLEEFRKHNNYYPENIFVFRSNITENHLKQVEEIEIPLIRAAIKKVSKNCKLNVIFSQAVQTGENLSYNLASGTVIDRSYKKSIYDVFYLINTQCSSLNTSKSTKYICLLNELKLSSDDLQKFCSYACHNCIRTSKITAIPIPVRYADLCAYRSKQHIEGQREAQSIEGSSMQEAKEQHIISQLNNWVKIHERVRNRLYYC